MWGEIVVPIVTAAISSGAVISIFKGIASLPSNRDHQKKVWEDLKDDALTSLKTSAKEEQERLEARVNVAESAGTIDRLKRDLMTNFCGLMLDDLEELGASPEKMNQQRALLRQINYTNDVSELRNIQIRSI